MTDTPKVYAAIAEVQADFSKMGLGKDGKNKFQGYDFRGIDSLMEALSPLLVKHGLIIIPHGKSHSLRERAGKGGKAMFHAIVEMEYRVIHKDDANSDGVTTIIVGPFYGEALDTSDKATNKAMSFAYKYMAFQTFCIPIKGQDEGDKDHNEVAPEAEEPKDPRTKAEIAKQVDSVCDLMVEVEAHDGGDAAVREIYSGKPYLGVDIGSMSHSMATDLYRDLTTVLSHLEEKKKKEKK